MLYLTNYGQKKVINNIQDLDLFVDNRHCIGKQPILLFFSNKKIILEKNYF